MAFTPLQIGGGAAGGQANIAALYSQANTLFGAPVFKAPQFYQPKPNVQYSQGSFVGGDRNTVASVPGGPQSLVGTRGTNVMGRGGYTGEMVWGQIPGTTSQYRWMTPEEFGRSGQSQAQTGQAGQAGSWAERLKKDAVNEAVGASGQGPTTKAPSTIAPGLQDIPYIRLANMLNTGEYNQMGLTRDQVQSAMNAMKG